MVAKRTHMVLASLVLVALSVTQIRDLQVRADFSHLLPPNTRSVRDLNGLKKRVQVFGTVFVVLEHDDPITRARATTYLTTRLQAHGGDLIGSMTADDGALRDFGWQHRFLYADLADIEEAATALRDRVKSAKLAANPLYIDLGDDLDSDSSDDDTANNKLADKLSNLRKRLAKAKDQAENPKVFVSKDKSLQLLIVRTTFSASSVGKGRRLMAAVNAAVADAKTEFGKSLEVGITGNVATTLYEQQSILRGMLIAAGITILLSTMALLLFFRSWWAVGSLLWALTVGSVITFGLTEVFIGHLNLATAFLAAIIVGNGINPGIMLLARYQEERRNQRVGNQAIEAAIRGAGPGTAAAACTAAVAYASLIVTDFRGFRHFGIIGGIGMVVCWLAAFTVLPALLSWFESRGHLPITRNPALGTWTARLARGHGKRVIAIALAVATLSAVATYRYVQSNPVEEDWRNLRSTSDIILHARAWNDRISNEFEGGYNQNISGRFAVATDSLEEARLAFQALSQANAKPRSEPERKPEPRQEQTLFAFVRNIESLLPPHQDRKIELLNEIRSLIDKDITAELDSESDRELVAELRPPDALAKITNAELPKALAWPFIERDGQRGRIVVAASSSEYQTWNVRDQVRFATKVREIELPESALVGGQAFVFADMLASMEADGPRATLVALIGSVIFVLFALGIGRHALVTVLSAGCGILTMVALVYAFGVKVNFLDFIALPITVGIGIDYAVNIATRERQDWNIGSGQILSTTGAAVALCSFTTTVGYGSLLLSENAGIRSFGLAAVLGEIACLAFALTLVPAFLHRWRRV